MTLRVKIEIIPAGDEDRKHEILRFDISNQGPTHFGHHKYQVIEINESGGFLWGEEILHRRDLGAAELVRKVLDKYSTLKSV